jgi:hypothetical protein
VSQVSFKFEPRQAQPVITARLDEATASPFDQSAHSFRWEEGGLGGRVGVHACAREGASCACVKEVMLPRVWTSGQLDREAPLSRPFCSRLPPGQSASPQQPGTLCCWDHYELPRPASSRAASAFRGWCCMRKPPRLPTAAPASLLLPWHWPLTNSTRPNHPCRLEIDWIKALPGGVETDFVLVSCAGRRPGKQACCTVL